MSTNEMPDIETLLPCGEKIRPLLVKSCITDVDLRNVLARRGVFIGNSQKHISVPLLSMSLISPREFEELQDKQKTKEDSLKVRTSSIVCDNSTTLVNMLPIDLIDAEKIELPNDMVEFNTDLSFSIHDTNKLSVEYKIKRNDVTKDWANAESIYEGRLLIQKDEVNKNIEFISEFTSEETQQINKEIVRCVRKHFISEGFLQSSDAEERITSSSFTDEERFKFMLYLTGDSPSGNLEFIEIKNVEIGPVNNGLLPKEMGWMEQTVKNMIINGDALQNLVFIKDDKYHESLILREIEGKYNFNYNGGTGTCIIEYGFPHYFRNRNTSNEFQTEIAYLHLSKEIGGANKKNVSRFLISEFNNLTKQQYARIREKNKVQ